jgi:mRNA-degrading endonuclease RelE of RelBE toxin-antitoxin system
MEFIRTQRFQRAYRKLESAEQALVKKALAQLLADRTYPGLSVKRIRGTKSVWELRAGRDIRVTFEIQEDAYLLRNVDHHDDALQNP